MHLAGLMAKEEVVSSSLEFSSLERPPYYATQQVGNEQKMFQNGDLYHIVP